MQVTNDRILLLPTRTIGHWKVDGVFLCYVLEDVVRDRDVDGDGDVDVADVAAFKVYGQTAIPAGRYRITVEHSPKFGPDTLTIHAVPGFDGIRIHSGNDESNTEGCPMLGYQLSQNATIRVGTTKPAVEDFKAMVQAAIARGEQVWLTVQNSFPASRPAA